MHSYWNNILESSRIWWFKVLVFGRILPAFYGFPMRIWRALTSSLPFLFPQSQALSHLEDSRVENSDRQHPVFSFHEDYSCQVLESTLPENFDNLTIDSQPLDCSNPKNSDKRLPLSIINEDDTSLSPENSSPRTESSGNYPLLSVILGMDSVARVSMLRKCINSLETKSTLSRSDCMWLFALCAAIDTPLHADTCAALRSLLRKCASLRAEKSELDDEVVMLNILVTIAGRYFKQSENWRMSIK